MERDANFFRAEWERVIGGADWFDRPMRWAQLVLVENDPPRYEPGFWLDYFRRVRADAACLSAGGCVAYYPTQVPWHYRSAWMGSHDDPFGDLVAGCRGQDMIVVARTDPHAIRDDAAEAHPEWVAVDADGRPRRHWAAPDYWVTCALGPHAEEQMTAIHSEIVARYWVDGIFGNRWAGHGICYCAYCRESFYHTYGMSLPTETDTRRDDYAAYLAWRENRLFAMWDLWDATMQAINPRARYIPNTGGGALNNLDMARTGARADILFADRQARSGLMPLWAAGMGVKEYRAALDDKPMSNIFSVGVEERYRWKDSVQSAPEVRLWAADATANGARPWFIKFAGVLHDQRWLPVVEQIFAWHQRHEPYLRNIANLATVGLVYSQQSARVVGGAAARERVEGPILGWYHALVEARVPFDMVHAARLHAANLARFKLLVLPNIVALSDAQCDQLRAFCAGGGSLIATHETSLYDERGRRRDDLGLADLFGASVVGPAQGPMQNAYLHPNASARPDHPLFAGLRDAERIIHGVHRLPTRAHEATTPLLTLVPSYPDLPMEQVFPRCERTCQPEAHLQERGGSRIVYLPWDIDRTYWEILNADHGALLCNAAIWAAGELPATVQGPGLLDVTVWRQESSLTVHLVNLTNPYMLKGPVREIYPVGEQRVRLRLPEGCVVRGAHLLGGCVLGSVRVQDGALEATISGVAEHEVLAVDLA